MNIDHRIIFILTEVLAGFTWIAKANEYLKFFAGIAALILAVLGMRSYYLKNKREELQIKIDRQRLAMMEEEYLKRFKDETKN